MPVDVVMPNMCLRCVQVGEGSIAALSTGGAVSKFGFPLQVWLVTGCAT
jgi:hypothetical protein